MENNEKDSESSLSSFGSGEKIQRQLVGSFIPKSEFLGNPTRCTIFGGGKAKYSFYLNVEIEGERVNFNISKINLNELIDLFGDNVDNWKGKEIIVVGKEWAGNDKTSAGVTLTISKP